MIYTKRLITIRNATASIDATVVLYRGDKDIEIVFEIIDSKFKFESSSGNLINNSHASYGQLVISCPNGNNTISDVMECENGLITFVMTGSMMDELTEVGKYSFHIRLFNEDKTSRVTLPPVMDGIEIREPLVIDDNTVDNAIVGYASIQIYGVEEPSFDENGNYMKTDWQTGDKITASKLNKIEETLETINNDIPSKTSELVNDSGFLSSIPSEYITESELNAKGYLTEHQDLSEYVTDEKLESKGYLTNIPNEYVTDEELNNKGYLTDHQDISGKADKTELHNHTNKTVLDGITSAKVQSWDNKSTFDGNYNSLTNKPTIPSISGLASESYVNEYVENAIKDIPKEEVDLSDYAKKTELPTKLSQLANDKGYIASIPSEYITESELNNKGYLTQHQDISNLATINYVDGKITEVNNVVSNKANKSEIPTKTSQLTNNSGFITSIPSEYVTDSELDSLTLGIHEDGLLYIFKDGSPKGIGIEMLSQEVIIGDLIGFIDNDKNIVLSGALAEDVYTLKYEMEDGTIVDVGQIDLSNKPAYTNQIPLSINSDGTPFNEGQGWKTGYRISKSSGGESALTNYECTGFIPVTKESTIRIKGIDITATDENAVVCGYDKNFTKLNTGNAVTIGAMIASTDDNGVSTFKGFGAFTHFSSTELAYIRVGSSCIDENSILTVNESII